MANDLRDLITYPEWDETYPSNLFMYNYWYSYVDNSSLF